MLFFSHTDTAPTLLVIRHPLRPPSSMTFNLHFDLRWGGVSGAEWLIIKTFKKFICHDGMVILSTKSGDLYSSVIDIQIDEAANCWCVICGLHHHHYQNALL